MRKYGPSTALPTAGTGAGYNTAKRKNPLPNVPKNCQADVTRTNAMRKGAPPALRPNGQGSGTANVPQRMGANNYVSTKDNGLKRNVAA